MTQTHELFKDEEENYDENPYIMLDNSGSEATLMKRNNEQNTVSKFSIDIIHEILKNRKIKECYCMLWNNTTILPFDEELVGIDNLLEIQPTPDGQTILFQVLKNIPGAWLHKKGLKDIYIVTDGDIQDPDECITKELKKLFGLNVNIYIVTVEANNLNYLIEEINSGSKLYSIIRENNMMSHLKEFISFNERPDPFISFRRPNCKIGETSFRSKIFRIDKTYEFINYVSKLVEESNSNEILKLSHELSLTIYYLIKDKPSISRNKIIDLFCKIFQNTSDYNLIRQSIFTEIDNHISGRSTTYHTYVADRKARFQNAQLSLYEDVRQSISFGPNERGISFTLEGLIIIVPYEKVDHPLILNDTVYNNAGFSYGRFTIPILPCIIVDDDICNQSMRGWIRNNLSVIYNTNPVSDYTIWKFILTYVLKILLNNTISNEIKLCFKRFVQVILQRLRYESDITEYNFLLKNPPSTNLGNEEKFIDILNSCIKSLNIKLEPETLWYGFIKIYGDKNLIKAQRPLCIKAMKKDKIDEFSLIDYLQSIISNEFTIIDLTTDVYDYNCHISNTDTSSKGGYIYPPHKLSDTIECRPDSVISYESFENLKDYNMTCPICHKIIESNEMSIIPPKLKSAVTTVKGINEIYDMNKCKVLDIQLDNIDMTIKKMDDHDFNRNNPFTINKPYLKDPLATQSMKIKTQLVFNEYVKDRFSFLANIDYTGAYILGGFCRSIILNQKVRDIDIHLCGNDCNQNFTRILEQLKVNFKSLFTNITFLIMHKEHFNVFELIVIDNPNNMKINKLNDISYIKNGTKILHRIQFILSEKKSLEEIFENVDFYPCMIAWDGSNTFMPVITAFSYKYMINIIDEKRYNDLFSYRLVKYFKYGFSPVLIHLDFEKLNNDYLPIDKILCEIIKKVGNCMYINIGNNVSDLEYEESQKVMYKSCSNDSLKAIVNFININCVDHEICNDILVREVDGIIYINDCIKLTFEDKVTNLMYYKDLYGEYRKLD